MAWTYFNQLAQNLGQRLSGIFAMADTGRSLLWEVLNELKGNIASGAAKFVGDLQATNSAVSGGASETYIVVLGEVTDAFSPDTCVVRNKYLDDDGPEFPVCSVQFGHVAADGSDIQALTSDTSLAGRSTIADLTVNGTLPVAAGRVLVAAVTVPAAVTVALGFDVA